MAETTSIQDLFKQWRSGQAQAGQVMAQRFTDWYYAIAVSRLGDQNCRTPWQRACGRFQQGILKVTNPAELIDWAYGIISDELRVSGGRVAGGDFNNKLTGGRSAVQLLQESSAFLSPETARLLACAYEPQHSIDTLTDMAESAGGMPFAILQARYQLKLRLKEQAKIAFTEVPDSPVLDRAPLPLYEAGRMSPQEEAGFEKWMLTDPGLCKDIAEFGVFVLALRHGAVSQPASPSLARTDKVEPVAPPSSSKPEARPPDNNKVATNKKPGPNLALLGGVTMVLLIMAVAMLFLFLRR